MIMVFSDIHGDKNAAKFVEKMVNKFTEVLCCGDICGYGKDFKYCIDVFRSNNIKTVLGNHDFMVMREDFNKELYCKEVSSPIISTKRRIKQKELDYLKSLPRQIDTDSGICIRHSVDIDSYVRSDNDCLPLLGMTNNNIICIGHTHVYKEHILGKRSVVNVGSISHGRMGTKPGYIIVDNGRVIHKEIDHL